jgi:hypothetical protein
VYKTDTIFMPGCGNAPLSPDMYKAGYHNQVNCDTADVVIRQMRERHGAACPKAQFHVMDATATMFGDEHFDAIVDKSLIDTLSCVEDGDNVTQRMVDEFYRVLKPGGTYVTFSLHSVAEIDRFFNNQRASRAYPGGYQWRCAGAMVLNRNYSCGKHGGSDSSTASTATTATTSGGGGGGGGGGGSTPERGRFPGGTCRYAVVVCQKEGGDAPRVDLAAALSLYASSVDPRMERALKAQAARGQLAARRQQLRAQTTGFLRALKQAHRAGSITARERVWFKDELLRRHQETPAVLLGVLRQRVEAASRALGAPLQPLAEACFPSRCCCPLPRQ